MGLSRYGARLSTVAIAFACLLPAAAGAAVPGPKDHGRLAPTLLRLADPAVRSQPLAKQAATLGVAASGPGSLIRRGGRVLVEVRFERGAVSRLDELRGAGARIVAASRRYQTVTATVPSADLRQVAQVPAVAAVSPVRTPILRAPGVCEGGAVISEGVNQLNVLEAREEFAVDGEGVTVGVLSDSFDAATEAVSGGPVATKAQKDEETRDLPGAKNDCAGQAEPVDVVEELGAGEEAFDEGRAMLQIVHDVAPQASLAFASAFNGELSFAQNVEELAKSTGGGPGAEVIVDDVFYFEEPFFQNGPIANSVEEVTAAGVTYLSAAGNDNLFDGEGNEIASWEAPAFRDSGGCPSAISSIAELKATHCLDFHPGAAADRTYGIKVEPGETLSLDLQWAEPWNGVDTDLDAFLLDAAGQLLTGSVDENINGTQRPVEIVQWTNESPAEATVQLVVNRYAGASPRLKLIFLQNGGGVSGVEYPRSGGGDVVGPSIFGHAAAPGAIAVGAVRFNTTLAPEPYSSRGPATLYFGPVSGTKPAAALPEPEVLSKPEIAATDCGATTFFARKSSGVWRFCGTSAAAPHAAGVVALMKEAEPTATPAQMRAALAGTGSPVGAFDSCAIGGGLVEAAGALEAIRGEIAGTAPAPCAPPDASGPVFVAPGNWGSEEGAPAPAPPAPVPTPGVVPQPPPAAAAPATTFLKRPAKVVLTRSRTARVVFRFGSDQPGVTFLCKIDKGVFRPCASRIARRFGVGSHVIRVKALNAAGLADPTPAFYRFRVKPLA
ncbi:MAG TPA: S8 family serine peptidase [Solirubrobacterales bacterium]|nr:S8 family serine peptidase [Solirubrobacterales bacterium]